MALPSDAHRVGLLRGVVLSFTHTRRGHRLSLVVADNALVRYCGCGDWWWT